MLGIQDALNVPGMQKEIVGAELVDLSRLGFEDCCKIDGLIEYKMSRMFGSWNMIDNRARQRPGWRISGWHFRTLI